MIKPEQIPDEVGYAASNALHSYPELGDFKVAIAAAINAWPGAMETAQPDWMRLGSRVILPLPQEKNDD